MPSIYSRCSCGSVCDNHSEDGPDTLSDMQAADFVPLSRD